jgi:hypothetical protein
MRILTNSGNDRVIDVLRAARGADTLDVATDRLSLFGSDALFTARVLPASTRLLVGPGQDFAAELAGSPYDRRQRNTLRLRALAARL